MELLFLKLSNKWDMFTSNSSSNEIKTQKTQSYIVEDVGLVHTNSGFKRVYEIFSYSSRTIVLCMNEWLDIDRRIWNNNDILLNNQM